MATNNRERVSRARLRAYRPSEERLEARQLLAQSEISRLVGLPISAAPHEARTAPVHRPANLDPPAMETSAISSPRLTSVVNAESRSLKVSTSIKPSAVYFPVPGSVGQTVTVTFRYAGRSAHYRNELAIYPVDDSTGRIGNLKPGDRGYAAAALTSPGRQLIFTQKQGTGAVKEVTLPSGAEYGFILVQNSSLSRLLTHNPKVSAKLRPYAFFSFSSANVDHTGHVRRSSNGLYDFEDQTGGGDRDFNDLILRVKYGTPQGVPKGSGGTTGGGGPSGGSSGALPRVAVGDDDGRRRI